LNRLKEMVSLHETQREVLVSVRLMREWVFEAEHILDGSWASRPEERSNDAVGKRFDAYLERLFHACNAEERTEDEKTCLGHLFKVLTHMRPHLTLCYDREDFPRTNNEMERTIRATKMHYRRISGRKNWNGYLLRYGCCVAYQEWWLHQPDGEAHLFDRLCDVSPASWKETRHWVRQSHEEQLHRFQFRHQPLNYLAVLEKRWGQTDVT
jgi:Transposase IS66 family